MKLHLTTFNVHGTPLPETPLDLVRLRQIVEAWIVQDPYEKLAAKGKSKGTYIPDIFVVAIQEMVPLNIEGFFENSEKAAAHWSAAITDVINSNLVEEDAPTYIPQEPVTMFGIALFLFIREELIKYIITYDRDNVRASGVGSLALGEKGGVAVSLSLGKTNLCFINAHLASGAGNLQDRIKQWHQINDELTFEEGLTVADHEYVFWLADTNSHLVVRNTADGKRVQRALHNREWTFLAATHDEVTLERTKRPMKDTTLMFGGYKEGLIAFPPTYKYQHGTQKFVIETPAFTDRILWRRRLPQIEDVEQGLLWLYDSTQSITISDHRPVTALLEVLIQPPDDYDPSRFANDDEETAVILDTAPKLVKEYTPPPEDDVSPESEGPPVFNIKIDPSKRVDPPVTYEIALNDKESKPPVYDVMVNVAEKEAQGASYPGQSPAYRLNGYPQRTLPRRQGPRSTHRAYNPFDTYSGQPPTTVLNGYPTNPPNQPGPTNPPNQYGPTSQPNQYGPTSQPNQYGPTSQPNQYGSTSQLNQHGPTSQPNQYGPTNPPNQYDPTNPPNQYDPTNPPNQYGPTSQPNQYGPTNPPNQPGPTNPPNQYGPTNPPNQHGPTNPPNQYGPTSQPNGYSHPSMPDYPYSTQQMADALNQINTGPPGTRLPVVSTRQNLAEMVNKQPPGDPVVCSRQPGDPPGVVRCRRAKKGTGQKGGRRGVGGRKGGRSAGMVRGDVSQQTREMFFSSESSTSSSESEASNDDMTEVYRGASPPRHRMVKKKPVRTTTATSNGRPRTSAPRRPSSATANSRSYDVSKKPIKSILKNRNFVPPTPRSLPSSRGQPDFGQDGVRPIVISGPQTGGSSPYELYPAPVYDMPEPQPVQYVLMPYSG